MNSFKKTISCIAALSLLASLTACGKKDKEEADSPDSTAAAKNVTIRFLNFKPEIAPVYEEIAEAYNAETGNTLIVETAANNTYEQTLSAKMSTSEAPVIFQINGPRGYANWRDYCLDMSDSKIYEHLID